MEKQILELNLSQIIEELKKCKKPVILVINKIDTVSKDNLEKFEATYRKEMDFDRVIKELENYREQRHTIFVLSSFGNLVKNGRMSKLTGFIAGKLSICGIGVASKEGEIVVKGKARGTSNIVSQFIIDMKENDFKSNLVVISHCQNLELAEKLREEIISVWNSATVEILQVGGLCGYYAERKGLIVAY